MKGKNRRKEPARGESRKFLWIKGTEEVRVGVIRKAKVVSEKHTSEKACKEMTGEVIQSAEEKHEKMP